MLIQTETFQKKLAEWATVYLTDKLHVSVSIGSIHYQLFTRVSLQDVYIEDLHKDTLLHAKKLKLKLGEIDFENHVFNMGGIELINTKAKLIKYKAEDGYNFKFIVDAFTSDSEKKVNNKPWYINFKEVKLINTDFTFRNENKDFNTTGINYFDLRTSSVNGKFKNVIIDHDTIFGKINYLAATEKSGFILRNLAAEAKIAPNGISLKELTIRTPYSLIRTNLNFDYSEFKDFLDFNNRVSLGATFDHSQIEMNDLSYFATSLKGLHEKLIVSGTVSGPISDLNGKNMNILIRGTNTQFIGNIKLKGLPNFEETAIYLNVKQIKTNYRDLKQMPVYPFTSQKTRVIPENISRLGTIYFKGTFAGFVNDFYAYGRFSTALGDLSSDLSLTLDKSQDMQVYKGKLKSYHFDFGGYFGIPSLGKVTANVDIGGSGFTLEKLFANLNGTINSLEFKGYSYQNIHVEGDIAQKIFNGKLSVNDENIDLDFSGKMDFANTIPKLDFVATISRSNLSALHLVDSTLNSNLSTKLVIDVTGNNIDDLNGKINFYNTSYGQKNEVYKMNDFSLEATQNSSNKIIALESDFVDGKIIGNFKILDLPLSIKSLLGVYLPSYFSEPSLNGKNQLQNFNFNLLLKNTCSVTELFAPDLSIATNSSLEGQYNSTRKKLNVTGNSSEISYKNYVFEKVRFSIDSDPTFSIKSGCSRLHISDSIWVDNFEFNSNTSADSVHMAVLWKNISEKETRGDLKAYVHFDSNKKFDFEILPSQFIVADSVWSIKQKNSTFVDTSHIVINNLVLEKVDQMVVVDGIISDNSYDLLKFKLDNLSLSNLNIFTKEAGYKFRGTVNGEFSLADLYNEPLFVSSNNFNSLYINDNKMGDGNIETIWNNAKKALYIHGSFSLGIVPNVLFSGNYYPNKKESNLNMELSFQAIQMEIFQPLVKDYCSDFSGFLAGRIYILGTPQHPKLSGSLNVNAKKVRVNYLNTIYNFSDKIGISNNSFDFNDLVVYDVNHNKATVNGKVSHTNFKKFNLDLEMRANKFNCLNTKESDNPLYYGKVFVSGLVNATGFVDDILIEANVKTESVNSNGNSGILNPLAQTEGSKLFIPINGSGEVQNKNFISFVKKDSVVSSKDEYKVKLGSLKLDFDLELTTDAEVQLIFDQSLGDIIKTRGNGNIKLNIDTKGDFKMYGNYVLESGDYLFTLKNLINKRFDIEKGSSIKWNGSPYKADLNLNSIYKARASISPFFVNDTLSAKTIDTKKRYPVDVKLVMTNDFLSPDIDFEIDLPTVDASTRQTVLSYVDNETELNRQVFSLLILNTFVQPDVVANIGTAATANTSEILSNQLNNMLRNISNDFDIGINYLPGDNISKEELEVALSTQLFNNKLSIDGNLGVSENNQSASNLVGDVNMDYKLTEDGKLRVKAFNKSNDISNQVISNGPYTQGVGAFYREEFNTLGELFRRYLHRIKYGKPKTEE